MADTFPTFPQLFALAREIVDSDAVQYCYAATQWDEFGDDGHVWLTTIVAETLARAPEILAARAFPEPPLPDSQLANGGACS